MDIQFNSSVFSFQKRTLQMKRQEGFLTRRLLLATEKGKRGRGKNIPPQNPHSSSPSRD